MLKKSFFLAATTMMLILSPIARAQQGRPGPAASSKDPATVPSGAYTLDGRHAAVVARVSHLGVSVSVFRFAKVNGSLAWNSANPTLSKVAVNVAANSITSIVPGFAEELAGEKWLDTAHYPDATFVSTQVLRKGQTKGTIVGNFTLHGITKPMEVQGEFVGSGKNIRGEQVVGFSGRTNFKRSDFGIVALPGVVGDEIEILIDLEFMKTAPEVPK